MLLGISAYTFSLFAAGTVDISVSVHLSVLEASFMILKNSSCSDNASILFVHLELVVISSCSFLLYVFCL